MTDQKPPNRKPLGPPLARTDADLDRLAEVTPADIEQAQAAVRAANPKLAKILDAKARDADQDQLD